MSNQNNGAEVSGPLIVSGLTKAYERPSQTTIFENVSFSVEPGEILAIFGPNGCGKSTLLKVISGLVASNDGVVALSGKHLYDSNLGYVPQNYRQSFFQWINLARNLSLTQDRPFKDSESHRDIAEGIKTDLGIDVDLNLRPHECSGGMLQQIAIVRALMGNKEVLFADEPFSALDYSVSKTIKSSFVKAIKERMIPAVVVLHNIEDIVEISDRVFVIPGRPFSTNEPMLTRHSAKLIENSHAGQKDSISTDDFVEFAERFLK